MTSREKFFSEFGAMLRAMVSRQSLAIWAGAFVLSVLTGPFGTFRDLDLGQRALFWGSVVTASVLVGHVSRAVASALVSPDRAVLSDVAAVTSMTVLLSPAIWGIGRWFEPVFVITMASFLEIALCVFSVAMVIFALRRVLPGIGSHTYRFGAAEHGSFPDTPTAPAPRLLRRLEPENRGDVLRITAQDHHVEIATSLGTQTMRMRLLDAIDEMDPIEGYCTHRSHWVTRDAIQRVERENGQKIWLHLSNGDRVPVSRKYRPDLEAAGIL